MSRVSLKSNASGTGTFTIESPNSNTDRTLTLPDSTGTFWTSGNDGNGGTAPQKKGNYGSVTLNANGGAAVKAYTIPSGANKIYVFRIWSDIAAYGSVAFIHVSSSDQAYVMGSVANNFAVTISGARDIYVTQSYTSGGPNCMWVLQETQYA